MEKMKSDVPLDYAIFQLSPKRTRCELFVSSGGNTEKLAAGLLEPFISHLKVAEEQVASAAQSVKLEVGRHRNAAVWFTKGTLERFVRFVSTPDVLELVNSSDAEMSQLEAAREIYSKGAGDQLSGRSGSGVTAADDATKKELLRAIDVRLMAVQQDLYNAYARAVAAGFNVDSVSQLQLFANQFDAHHLSEACGKFILLCNRRPNLVNQWGSGPIHRNLRSSCGSDMPIDDDSLSSTPREEPLLSQQPNPPPVTFPSSHTFSRDTVERGDGEKLNDASGEKCETSTPEQTVSIQGSQPARRLSVQDRINMFENKQKESSGGNPNAGKSVELRRLPSDVSSAGAAAEKIVLRRWSGVSDMSIDFTVDKKDIESSSLSPTPTTVSLENKVSEDDTAKSFSVVIVNQESEGIPSLSGESGSRLKYNSNKTEHFLGSNVAGPDESDGLKDQVFGKTQSMSSSSVVHKQGNWEEKSKNFLGSKTESSVGYGNQGKLKDQLSGEDLNWLPSEITAINNKGSSVPQIKPIGSKVGEQVYTSNQKENSASWNEPVIQTSSKSVRRTAGDGSRICEPTASRYKGNEGDFSSVQQDKRSLGGTIVEKISSGSVSVVEDIGLQRSKFHEQSLEANLSKKAKVKREKIGSSGINRGPFSGKVTAEALEGFDSFSTPPPDRYQRVRQSKGNQDLNDDLKMKANELEKLFAQHKLRVPGDQSHFFDKDTSGDTHVPVSISDYSKSVKMSPLFTDKSKANESTGSSRNKTKSDSAYVATGVDSLNNTDALEKNFSDLTVSKSSRGKLYNKYIRKRDTKLMEDWSSNRAEKEARLKSMQDVLERNRSEMKVKLFGSVDRQGSGTRAHQRAERLKSYNSSSIIKRGQKSLEFEDSEDDAETSDILKKNCTLEDKTFNEISSGDGIFRGSQGKKLLSNNRHFSSSSPRTSVVAVPRSTNKISSNSGNRRTRPENPLAQSVPNFSDLRKENTKPSGGSKTTRSQARNYIRSKSTNEEAATVKEDKRLRFQSTRRSSANPREMREMYPQDSDVDFAQVKFDEEVQRSVGTKPFLKKGSRAGCVSQTSIPRLRVSVETEPANNVDEDDNDDVVSGPDESTIAAKDEWGRNFEALNSEEHKNLEDEESTLRLDTEKFVNSGSENGEENLTFSRVGHVVGSQLLSEIPSSFLPSDVHDWPGESPMSWNSRSQHLFSNSNVMSDVDASADSPGGSPASWNSNYLNQMETDSARMRKKWGMAQKPMLVAHSSNSSRKDMARGFKRFLKFGRKNRGSEGLVDWISATTSEGDDDTEDGRDPANRSSEDLRKSRMGFSHPSDDSFNENEVFNESVQSSGSSIPAPPSSFKLREDHLSGSSIKGPRSFFSLSTFRSKGNESKPR